MSATTDSSTDAPTAPAKPAPAAKPGPKKKQTAVPVAVHPKQAHAIRYVNFMAQESQEESSESGKPFQDFITEAVARELGRLLRKGVEFPPKMLTELQALGLLK